MFFLNKLLTQKKGSVVYILATTRVATLGTHCHWVPTHTNTRKHHALGLARLCDAGTLGDCVVCDGVCASCECVRVVSDSEALCPLSTLACKFRKNSGTHRWFILK